MTTVQFSNTLFNDIYRHLSKFIHILFTVNENEAHETRM